MKKRIMMVLMTISLSANSSGFADLSQEGKNGILKSEARLCQLETMDAAKTTPDQSAIPMILKYDWTAMLQTLDFETHHLFQFGLNGFKQQGNSKILSYQELYEYCALAEQSYKKINH